MATTTTKKSGVGRQSRSNRTELDYRKIRFENQTLRGHELLPGEVMKRLPQLYKTEGQGLQAVAQVKFFSPESRWTWYGVEYDGQDTLYGLVIGHYIELGYFSLSELEVLRGPMGLPVERDLYFEPTRLKVLKLYHQQLGVESLA